MLGQEHFQNPYATWAGMRSGGPVQRRVPSSSWPSDTGIDWIVLGHAEVRTLGRNPTLSKAEYERLRFVDLSPEVQEAARPLLGRYSMLRKDPPDHTRLRGQATSAFSIRSVDSWRPRIEALTHGLIDKVFDTGAMEVVGDLAFPLPAIIIMELLGVPVDDRDRLRALSAASIEFVGELRTTANPAELLERATASQAAMRRYAMALVAEKRTRPQADFISTLVSVQQAEDGRLNEEEVLAQAILLLGAGHETTTNLIANGLLALLRHPEQLERLRSDPSLMPSAVEELLRYDPPVQLLGRATTAPIELSGQVIPAGQRVNISIAAANRDPQRFVEPDLLDIGRDQNDHLAFGFDRHLCLGAQLARLEAQIALGALIERLPRLRLATDKLEFHPNMVFRALRSLPVVW
ncbi:cytochrome P450 [Rhizobium rhizogenes]|uniref:cytochrome P450 n=1 Tax=Rhizobium rhizogenes TaxID=359 RepID=UPI0015718C24|nr:cytochrome P450 [Rhizobium rhizogenes]NTF66007.1 cytochrome P450 [Rhizobium rhizogenes]NTG97392.1 cytochrome P450 [Rhizobium rhizogenes]NTJ36364.1 cytochrome P450 [Rhizobium rhizogenes]